MGKPSPASRRAALQAQREAALRAQRRGRRIGALVGAVVALALVAALALWWNGRNRPDPVTVGAQVAVPDAASDGTGVVVAKTPAGTPTLVVIEDFQCPWCKVAHQSLGSQVQQLVDDKQIGLQYRSITLIDAKADNDASYRANVAAACADVTGGEKAYRAYHDVVFAHQPKDEGDGFSDAQLRDEFAKAAGIKDVARFQSCFDQRQTKTHVESVLTRAAEAKLDTTTPQYWVADDDGKLVDKLDLDALVGQRNPTAEELLAAIKAAA